MAPTKVFMTKGDGEHSYQKNSSGQKATADALIFPILEEAVHQMSLPQGEKSIVVVDLGCSTGSNSIQYVSHVVKLLQSASKVPRDLEIQACFNDLQWTDFDQLLQNLSERETERAKFFPAIVPGSFFGRLFPESSVHVFLSMFAAHFLSTIPESVTDESSTAFNGGNLWLQGSTDATAKAYEEQSSLDLKSFLHARAEELAPGGLLCFIIKTRQQEKGHVLQSTEDSVEVVQICLHETTEDVLSKGILTKQQVDSLNVPLYYPLFQEVSKIIESFSSSFEIHTAKEVGFPMVAPPNSSSDPDVVVRTAVKLARGFLGGMFEETMGVEGAESFWRHFSQQAKKYASALRQDSQFGCFALFKK